MQIADEVVAIIAVSLHNILNLSALWICNGNSVNHHIHFVENQALNGVDDGTLKEIASLDGDGEENMKDGGEASSGAAEGIILLFYVQAGQIMLPWPQKFQLSPPRFHHRQRL